MIYKVTYGFTGLGVGWSETHAMKNSSDTAQVALASAIAVAEKRVTFLGREFSINVVRVSLYSNDEGTQRARGIAPSDIGWANPVQLAIQAAEPAVVALKVTGFTNAALSPTYKSNTNRTYCGAPADAAVDNGGFVDTGKAGLLAAFNQWTAALTFNQFGWLGQKRNSDTEIATITQLGNGKVEFVTTVLPDPVPVIGAIYPARVRQVNGGVSPLNGELIVRYTAAKTFVTQETIGLALAQTGGSIRVYNPIMPFIQYANLTLAGRTAKHKRGRPFGSSPGRAAKRVRG